MNVYWGSNFANREYPTMQAAFEASSTLQNKICILEIVYEDSKRVDVILHKVEK